MWRNASFFRSIVILLAWKKYMTRNHNKQGGCVSSSKTQFTTGQFTILMPQHTTIDVFELHKTDNEALLLENVRSGSKMNTLIGTCTCQGEAKWKNNFRTDLIWGSKSYLLQLYLRPVSGPAWMFILKSLWDRHSARKDRSADGKMSLLWITIMTRD